jgi:hypothetical protein
MAWPTWLTTTTAITIPATDAVLCTDMSYAVLCTANGFYYQAATVRYRTTMQWTTMQSPKLLGSTPVQSFITMISFEDTKAGKVVVSFLRAVVKAPLYTSSPHRYDEDDAPLPTCSTTKSSSSSPTTTTTLPHDRHHRRCQHHSHRPEMYQHHSHRPEIID